MSLFITCLFHQTITLKTKLVMKHVMTCEDSEAYSWLDSCSTVFRTLAAQASNLGLILIDSLPFSSLITSLGT